MFTRTTAVALFVLTVSATGGTPDGTWLVRDASQGRLHKCHAC